MCSTSRAIESRSGRSSRSAIAHRASGGDTHPLDHLGGGRRIREPERPASLGQEQLDQRDRLAVARRCEPEIEIPPRLLRCGPGLRHQARGAGDHQRQPPADGRNGGAIGVRIGLEQLDRLAPGPVGGLAVGPLVGDLADHGQRRRAAGAVVGQLGRAGREDARLVEREPGQVAPGRLQRVAVGAGTVTGEVEVVGQELGHLAPALAERRLDPLAHAGVRGGPVAPGQGLVGDVAGEDVLEDQLALAGHRRADPAEHEVAPLEAVQRLLHLVGLAVQEAGDGAGPEDPADDGRGLHRALLGRRQQVDPRRQHALDGVGQRHLLDALRRAPAAGLVHDQALVDQPAQDLLQEERIALGPLQDPVVGVVREAVDVQEQAHQLVGVAGAERLERDARGAAAPAAPARPAGGQLRPGRAQEQGRRLDPVGELLEQVEHRRIGPVDVIHDDDQRPAPRRAW